MDAQSLKTFRNLATDLGKHEQGIRRGMRPDELYLGVGRLVRLASKQRGVFARLSASGGAISVDMTEGRHLHPDTGTLFTEKRGDVVTPNDRMAAWTHLLAMEVEGQELLRTDSSHDFLRVSPEEVQFLNRFFRDRANVTATYTIGNNPKQPEGFNFTYLKQPLQS